MKIPATVITGFLGAGKTTLIRHLIENAGGKRIALVINEFGGLGIDRELIMGCGIEGCDEDDVVELTNGCICCTVADDFLPTIQKLIDRDQVPDHIVIETSGLALPKPLVKAFSWPEIRSRVTVDGVVAVIDAPAVNAGRFADDPDAVQAQREADEMLDHENPLEEVFEDQLKCADLVVLNKVEALDAEALDAVRASLKPSLRPATKVVMSDKGAVDIRAVLGIGAAAEDDLETRPSHHDGPHDHDHDDFASFVLDLGDINDPEALDALLTQVAVDHDILRMKGFLNVPGKPLRLVVQAVGPRLQKYFDRPWAADEVRSSKLVVIAEHHVDQDAVARAILKRDKAA